MRLDKETEKQVVSHLLRELAQKDNWEHDSRHGETLKHVSKDIEFYEGWFDTNLRLTRPTNLEFRFWNKWKLRRTCLKVIQHIKKKALDKAEIKCYSQINSMLGEPNVETLIEGYQAGSWKE